MRLRVICEDVGSDLRAVFSRFDAGEDPALVAAVLVDFLRDLGPDADKWLIGGSVDDLEENLGRGGKKRVEILYRMLVSLNDSDIGVLCALGRCNECGVRCVASIDKQFDNGYVRSNLCEVCLESALDGEPYTSVADFGW